MKRTLQKLMQEQRASRQARIRGKLHGTAERPRLSVNRSNQHVMIQAINDDARVTIAGGNDNKLTGTKTERAITLARNIAAGLKKAGVKAVVFDRGEFRYHGRVKAIADALREEGIQL